MNKASMRSEIYDTYLKLKADKVKFPMKRLLEIYKDTHKYDALTYIIRIEREAREPATAGRRIISWDIETLPMETHEKVWRQGDKYIKWPSIKIDKHIYCISYKVLYEKKVYTIAMNQEELKGRREYVPFCDDRVVKEFYDFLQPGDVLVAWNGNGFDWKEFYGRVIDLKLPPLINIHTVDPMRELGKVARYASKALDYVSQRRGTGEKRDTGGMALWDGVCEGDPKAIKNMIRYCENDVVILENEYLNLLPYMKSHPNIAEPMTYNCGRCNGPTSPVGVLTATRSGIRRMTYRCENCGGVVTARSSRNAKPLLKI